MNKIRRKALRDIIAQLEAVRNSLALLRRDEQKCICNMPKNMRDGAEQTCIFLDDATDCVVYAVRFIGFAAE